MRIFVYKLLITISLIFVLYHATLGFTIKSIKSEIYTTFEKEKIIFLRNKIKDELKSSLKKDKILNDEDATLIRNIIKKLSKEINAN